MVTAKYDVNLCIIGQGWVETNYTEKVKCEECLCEELTPELHQKLLVHSIKAHNKVIIKYVNDMFSRVVIVDTGGDELEAHSFSFKEQDEGHQCLIFKALEAWSEAVIY